MRSMILGLVVATGFVLSGGTAHAVTYCVGGGKATYEPNGRYSWSGDNGKYKQRWEGSPGTGVVRVYGAETGILRRVDTYKKDRFGHLIMVNRRGEVFQARRC